MKGNEENLRRKYLRERIISKLLILLVVVIMGFATGVLERIDNPIKTKGVIIETKKVEVSRSSSSGSKKRKNQYSKEALVEFEAEGETISFWADYSSDLFREGNKMTVVYNEENIQEYILRPPIVIYAIMTVFTLVVFLI